VKEKEGEEEEGGQEKEEEEEEYNISSSGEIDDPPALKVLFASLTSAQVKLDGMGATFNSWQDKTSITLPLVLQLEFRGGNDLYISGYDQHLGEHLLDSSATGAENARLARNAYNSANDDRRIGYNKYMKSQQERDKELHREKAKIANTSLRWDAAAPTPHEPTVWPSWLSPGVGNLLSAPTWDNLNTYGEDVFNRVFPLLEADLISQVPGERVSGDHTFNLASVVIGADNANYSFFLGEDHRICRFLGGPSTAFEHQKAGLTRWAETLRRQWYYHPTNGWMSAYSAITGWDDDLCCNGGNHLSHPLMRIFPLFRAPYKDGFHAVQMVGDTLQNKEEQAEVERRLGAIIRKPVEEPDLKEAIGWLQRRPKNRIDDKDEARRRALSTHRRSIRTEGRDGSVLKPELVAERDFQQARLEEWKAKPSGQRGAPPAYRDAVHQGPRGSSDVMNSLISCAEKGCLSDGRPLDQCYICERIEPLTTLPVWLKKQGSGKNEAWHRVANLLRAEVCLSFHFFFCNSAFLNLRYNLTFFRSRG